MQSFPRLSTLCFPEKIWKRSAANDSYSQQTPTDADIRRREALAAWQLGYCTLDEARAALRRIERLERQLETDIEGTLRALGPREVA